MINLMSNTIDFLNIRINALTLDEMPKKIAEFALADKTKFITYVNAHCINVSFTDFEYKKILQNADLVYTGGQGVIWASRFLGVRLPERVNILDFFDALTEQLIDKGITIYLLGGIPRIVKKTARVLKKKGLKIVGSRSGFFDREEEKNIIKEINILRPNILMVGMGVPKQEKWIIRQLESMNVNLFWGVGAAFEWMAGYRKRAPAWMIKCGLEWLHRLYQQPKRLWKRYLLGNFFFICRILTRKFKKYE